MCVKLLPTEKVVISLFRQLLILNVSAKLDFV